MELGYLISPVVQIVDHDGKPIVGAKIYVYNANTTVLVDTYNDFEGHLNTNPVLTDTLGNCTIIADTSKVYDIIVNDENDTLLFGKKNISIASGIDPSSSLVFESGYGITVERTGNTVSISVDNAVIATQDDLATKQDKLIAGENIDISNQNVISVTGKRTLGVTWPLKFQEASNKLNLYIDTDWEEQVLDNIVAGTDLRVDEISGTRVIGVDTDSTIDENVEYGFVANKSNTLHGDYGVVFGQNNSVSGSRNAAFGGSNEVAGYSNFACGYDNDAHGSMNFVANNMNAVSGSANTVLGASNTNDGNYNFIAGQNNTVSANSCGIISQNMNVTADNSYVFGKAASAIPSGTVLGANSTNMFELRNNKTIYYNYNDQLVQLKPSLSISSIVYKRPTLSLESRNYLNENVYTTVEIPANTLFDGSITINNYRANAILTYVDIGTTIENVSTYSYVDDLCIYPMTMNATGDEKMLTVTIPIIFKNDSNVARKIGIRLNGSVMQQTLQLIIKGVIYSI